MHETSYFSVSVHDDSIVIMINVVRLLIMI